MKLASFIVLLTLGMLLGGCQSYVAKGSDGDRDFPPPPRELSGMSDLKLANYELGESIQVDNMTVVPLKLKGGQFKESAPPVDYLTLDEASQRGTIVIRELDNPQVELLKVKNTGSQPILLIGGDLLLGGQQDRVVQQDTIIQPGSTIAVKVFCVEHGRWSGDPKFKYQAMKAPTAVRKAATFYGDQHSVWSRVEDSNTRLRAKGGSTSVREGLTVASDSSEEKLERILSALREQDDIVGVVFAVNGKVQSLEVYGAPRLFQASAAGLLRGYIADAMTVPVVSREEASDHEVAGLVRKYEEMRKESRPISPGSSTAAMSAPGYRGAEINDSSKATATPLHGFLSPE